MAAIRYPPLKETHCYIPAFKVPVYLSAPRTPYEPNVKFRFGSETPSLTNSASSRSSNQSDSRAEQFSLWYSLQLLAETEIEGESFQNTGNPSVFFQGEASVLLSNLIRDRSAYEKYAALCPEAIYYAKEGKLPTRLIATNNTIDLSGYFIKMAEIHQLINLSSQINSDITALPSHKYIPHQLALLHKALGLLDKSSPFYTYKPLIEERFSSMKTRLRANNNVLIQNHEDWLMELTSDLVEYAESLPSDISNQVIRLIPLN